MSQTLNKVILIGFVGSPIKLSYFDAHNCTGRFSLVTREFFTNKQGEKIPLTEWHSVVVKNQMAETFEKYLSKGDLLYLEGKLKNRQWQDNQGDTHYSTEIHITDFKFLYTQKEKLS